MSQAIAGPRRIMFLSSNESWGGSEELWSRTALALRDRGHDISAGMAWTGEPAGRLTELRLRGCTPFNLRGPRAIPRRIRSFIHLIPPWSQRFSGWHLCRAFRRYRPELVVISQGINHDGAALARLCRAAALPYVLISQKADDLYWPHDRALDAVRAAHAGARATFFVSYHNLALTEDQLGMPLPNGEVVRNPFSSHWHPADSWPDNSGETRLACLARLDAREKGHDLLLRVLAMPKWRARPLRVALFGSGHNAAGLAGMARRLELDSLSFAGFAQRPEDIWRDHHGLILPSRCEGLPLSLVEAMLNGRVAIVTDVGGNAELVDDGQTGFIAAAPTVAALDEALERAWQRRAEWRAIGQQAAAHARETIPREPEQRFADRLLALFDVAITEQITVGQTSDNTGRAVKLRE